MAFFSSSQAILAAGGHVYFARFVAFDFLEGVTRCWEGFGPVVMDGHTWLGAGEVGSISEIPIGLNDTAGNVTFTLSGVDPEIVALARTSASVRGRPVTIYGKFFDTTLQPVDDTILLAELEMDVIRYSGAGSSDRRITLTAESLWSNRNGAAFAYFSDRDQQARFAGDKGLEHIAGLSSSTRVRWPIFT